MVLLLSQEWREQILFCKNSIPDLWNEVEEIIHAVHSILCCYIWVGKIFKVDGYTFRGSNSAIFLLDSHINWGHLIKEEKCLPLGASFWEAGKQTGFYKNCLPLKSWEVYPYTYVGSSDPDSSTVDSRYLDFGYLEQPLISNRKSDPSFNIEI